LDRTAIRSAACVASLAALYLLFLFQTASILDKVESAQNFRFHSFLFDNRNKARIRGGKNDLPQNTNSLPDGKYLIFHGRLGGQGTGNIISGLLSAHLMGEEFNRTVCVQDYDAFLELFEPVHPVAVQKCPQILPQRFPPTDSNHHIRLINYIAPPDECALQAQLASDVSILFMTGNTYARWPTVPDQFFFRYYRAKPELLAALPYDPQAPPTTVVHLREPDNEEGDFRKGLDEASLKALGDLLPKGPDTFLVTNNVLFYERFEVCCQWSHPHWNTVIHSATQKQWGSLPGASRRAGNDNGVTSSSSGQQNLQMWADWYTILTAQTVYHTHSDFSVSAIHWTNKKDSHSIQGINKKDGTLKTVPESWWVDGETEPLSQRRRDAQGTAQLRLCK